MALKINDDTKHVVCYSGGHSSALVAIEVARRYGRYSTYLINHDINPRVEHPDIKRFKQEVADYLGIPITYANHKNWDTMDQFDVCESVGYINQPGAGAVCTHRLKMLPFKSWLHRYAKDKNVVIYYGFDKGEKKRMQRRSSILGNQGYQTDYPLALWKDRTIESTKDIGIEPPLTYTVYKHANCLGCLKAGKQHWYVIYCREPHIWQRAKEMEEKVGYTILKDRTTNQPVYLEELEPTFEKMKKAGVPASDNVNGNTFWGATSRLLTKYEKSLMADSKDEKPCECFT